jgi:hypothetical protein
VSLAALERAVRDTLRGLLAREARPVTGAAEG